ncbi:MAG: response regulator [Geovibrio sp.]|uniref:response regulator n=1 Tax=Geovibrio ferrireducens TaxID=46201 RepID=UPI002245B298|nr:response regulator [Geovibrio ferrireducens]MCD8569073.1 response regulator [Geovibrio sp.]
MMRILLAEDNPVNQMITRKIVEKLGTKVDVAGNGREAVDMVQKESYALILMDVNMPVMNGADAAAEIRRMGYGMPIVALTADSETMTAELENCGMTDFISKPVNIAKIEALINSCKKPAESPARSISSDSVEGCINYVFTQLGLEREIVTELLGEFVEDSKIHLEYLIDAVRARDMARAASEAHYIKGAARNMGLRNIAAAAEIIEKNARSNSSNDYELLYKDLKEKLTVFAAEFSRLS